MKTKFIFSALCLCLSIMGGVFSPCMMAQNSNNIVISGKIVTGNPSESVPFAKVSLQIVQASDTLRYGQITDENGLFRISIPASRPTLFTAESMGLKKVLKQLSPSETSKDIKMGNITMEEDSQTLGAVTIEKRIPLVSVQPDRLGYELDKDPEAGGQNLLTMLRKVPLVTVDAEENVQVKGSSNYKILLNGKPNPMFDSNPKEILRSIPASSVKRVEVITDPGVKYDAQGVSAVINIVTATISTDGLTGNISLGVAQPQFMANGSLYLAMKSGKWGSTVNLSGITMNKEMSADTEISQNAQVQNKEQQDYKYKMDMLRGSVLISYEHDAKNLFTLTSNFSPIKNKLNGKTLVSSIRSAAYNSFERDVENHMNMNNMNASLDYQHSFNRPGELLVVSYRFVNNPFKTTLWQDIESQNYHSKMLDETKMNEHSGQIDYTLPIGKYLLESGLKYIYRENGSDISYQMKDPSSGAWVSDPSYTGKKNIAGIQHKNHILAAYTGLSATFGKLNLKVGVRGEANKVDAGYKNESRSIVDRRFIDFVPHLSLNYSFSPIWIGKLSYRERINRPSVTQLNPVELRQDQYNIQKGNLHLDVVRSHNVQASITNMGAKHMLMLSGDFEQINNGIEQIFFKDPSRSNVFISTPANVGKQSYLTGSLYAMYRPSSWLQTSVNGSLIQSWAKGLDNPIVDGIETAVKTKDLNALNYNVTAMAMLSLPHNWSSTFSYSYMSPTESLQTRSSAYSFHSFSLTKQLMQQRLSISLSANNVFVKDLELSRTRVQNDLKTTQIVRFPMRQIMLSVSYRFGGLKGQVKKAKKTIVNDDLMEGNNNSLAPTTPKK